MAVFTVSTDRAYLVGSFTENLTEASAFALIDELLALSSASGLTKVLIDARHITVPLQTPALYQLGAALATRLAPTFTMAVVMSNQAGTNRIFQTVLSTHGLTLRYFRKLDAARTWLLGSHSEAPD